PGSIRIRGFVPRLPERGERRVRHLRLDLRAAVVEWADRHLRWLVRRADAVAGGAGRGAGVAGDGPERDRGRLPRGLVLPGRGVRAELHQELDADLAGDRYGPAPGRVRSGIPNQAGD